MLLYDLMLLHSEKSFFYIFRGLSPVQSLHISILKKPLFNSLHPLFMKWFGGKILDPQA